MKVELQGSPKSDCIPMSSMLPNSWAKIVKTHQTDTIHPQGTLVYRTVSMGNNYPFQFMSTRTYCDEKAAEQYMVIPLVKGEQVLITV